MRTGSARKTLSVIVLLISLALSGCKADNVIFTVRNDSGGTVHDVKVGFPGNEFTISTLGDSTIEATHRHFSGPGRLTISFSTDEGRTYSSSGPPVTGTEKGRVDISIEGSHANFETRFEDNQQ